MGQWGNDVMMQIRSTSVCVALMVGAIAMTTQAQKGGEDITGPYTVVESWMKPFARPGYIQGSQGGVFAESPDRIFVLNRGELKLPDKLPVDFNGAWGSVANIPAGPVSGTVMAQAATLATSELRNCILVLDGTGRVVESWTQWDKLFQGGRGPHHVKISPYDPDRHVWVVDDNRHQVFKFTNDGKQLALTLGEAGVPGNDDRHFARPTDIAFLPDGTFFVTDGYINTRVVKFDKTGKYLMTWGTPGNGPGQFNLPHSIDIDRDRRLYVADRQNSRVQIFDENGKFLDQWPNIRRPVHILIGENQRVWVADLDTNKLLQYDTSGRLLSSWGTWGTFPGGFWGIHQFSVDSQNNLYVAETYGGRTQKFTPKPSAPKAQLIGSPVALMMKR
jgi:DNA-binding beta-propeller fold protein YncE